jgi:hypothetical protein
MSTSKSASCGAARAQCSWSVAAINPVRAARKQSSNISFLDSRGALAFRSVSNRHIYLQTSWIMSSKAMRLKSNEGKEEGAQAGERSRLEPLVPGRQLSAPRAAGGILVRRVF